MRKSKHQDVVEAPAVPVAEVEIEAVEPDGSVGAVMTPAIEAELARPAPPSEAAPIPTVTAVEVREDTEPEAPKSKHKSKPGPTVFRVARGGRFSSNGHICTVVEGHVVRLSAYGTDGLERMRANGIVLDPIG